MGPDDAGETVAEETATASKPKMAAWAKLIGRAGPAQGTTSRKCVNQFRVRLMDAGGAFEDSDTSSAFG